MDPSLHMWMSLYISLIVSLFPIATPQFFSRFRGYVNNGGLQAVKECPVGINHVLLACYSVSTGLQLANSVVATFPKLRFLLLGLSR
ncbi:hypothetical protein RHGRI_037270 [Rhododendron griersonianum]|uniref:Uncharacterized protein n=1 Tax=Rhododendron griersonianum TaxID=479676 RepID=A0AAV6HR69_9ERIC|nr:hypothetical protein RHGRI_037270 [Rhododendron griersonianum]